MAQSNCPNSPRPVLELELEVAPPDKIIAVSLETHLRAELNARSIDVCIGPVAPRTRIALVRLLVERSSANSVVATLQVRDEVTDKRIERVLDLSRLPGDARSTAVASSADELLRASWIELSMSDAPPPKMEPPSAILQAVSSSLRSSGAPLTPRSGMPRVPFLDLGFAGSFTSFVGSREALGGVVSLVWWGHPRVGLSFHAGGHVGFARPSLLGDVRGNDLFAGLGLAFGLTPPEWRWGLRLDVESSVARVTFDAFPAAGVLAQGAEDVSVTVGSRVDAWLRTGRVRWIVGLGGLGALRAVRATDGMQTITAIAGAGIHVTAGASIVFE